MAGKDIDGGSEKTRSRTLTQRFRICFYNFYNAYNYSKLSKISCFIFILSVGMVITYLGSFAPPVSKSHLLYEKVKKEIELLRSYDGNNLINVHWEKMDEKDQSLFLIDENMIVYDVFIRQGSTVAKTNVPELLWGFDKILYTPPIWETDAIDLLIKTYQNPGNKNLDYAVGYKNAYIMLSNAFTSAFNVNKHIEIAVMGSMSPWVEGIVLAHGAKKVTTCDYNLPISYDDRIVVKSIQEVVTQKNAFDLLISYSSIEHDGLGRYGDPINPNGDVAAMLEFWYMLKKDGLLFLSVPCNNFDALIFNQHRVYGPKRFKYFTEKYFKVLKIFDNAREINSLNEFFGKVETNYESQPVFVLQKIENSE